ncbi:MAG: DUF116 domain-containing protein [Thermoproteota archaeon]|nr:DUF116 domain-containing protein [Thermoproteota archaeon]
MPYRFSFDLTRIPKLLFKEVALVAGKRNIHRKIGRAARNLVEKFKVHELTGLDVSDALTLLEDLIDIQIRNLSQRESFLKTKRRVLFLPHCSRKYMDNRCKAKFNAKFPSYFCMHCSPDCLINQATVLGQERGYDVYVLPGGSCVPRILKENSYEGVVGVSCGEEIKLAADCLQSVGLLGQAVPLIKNGCANTTFNIEKLREIL